MVKQGFDRNNFFRNRVGDTKPSPPNLNIYLNVGQGNNHGTIQVVFDWMRSGEWLTALMARELWGIYTANLHFVFRSLRMRGWVIECKVFETDDCKRKYFRYRLLTWEPNFGGQHEHQLQFPSVKRTQRKT